MSAELAELGVGRMKPHMSLTHRGRSAGVNLPATATDLPPFALQEAKCAIREVRKIRFQRKRRRGQHAIGLVFTDNVARRVAKKLAGLRQLIQNLSVLQIQGRLCCHRLACLMEPFRFVATHRRTTQVFLVSPDCHHGKALLVKLGPRRLAGRRPVQSPKA